MINEQEALKIFREIIENTKITIEKHPAAFAAVMENVGARLFTTRYYIQHDKLSLCYYRLRNLRTVLGWKWDYLLQEQVREHLEASLSKADTELNAVTMHCLNVISRYILGDIEGRATLNIGRLRSDLEGDETFKATSEELQSRVLLKLSTAVINILDSFISSRREEVSQLCNKLIQACDQGWDSVFSVMDDCILSAERIGILEMRR